MTVPTSGQGETHPSLQKRIDQTKRHVCDTAARLFNEASIGDVSIESIISEAGIARSTFYRWFKDRDDLLGQIINPTFQEARQHLEVLDRTRPEHIPNGVADSYLLLWHNRRESFLLTSAIGKSEFQIVEESHNDYVGVLFELMTLLNDNRMLRNDDPHLAAVILGQIITRLLKSCETHPQFANVFRSTFRGIVLKW